MISKRTDVDPPDEVDDDGSQDPTPVEVRRRWVFDPERERRAGEIREAVRGGFMWPAWYDEVDKRQYGTTRVTAENVDEYGLLCSKRGVVLELVTLRKRIEQWFTDFRDTASDEQRQAWTEFLDIIDDRLMNNGAEDPDIA